MKNKRFFIYFFFLSAAVLSILVSSNLLLPRFVWINESLHSTVEAFGSLAAIFMAVMLLHRKHEEGGGRLFWMAVGLINMGLLIGFHSVTKIGHGFILLFSVACFSGGFWFSLVWLPESDRFSRIRKWIPWIVATGSVLLGVWTLLFRETMPLMVENGKFTLTAILINLLAGLFFLAATVRFLLDFNRSGKKESFLFSCMTLLFSLANLSFPFSAVWDNVWWFWHLLRVLAFVFGFWFVLKSDLQAISTLRYTIVEKERIEESLRESENSFKKTRDYLETLLNYANAPIIVWDSQFRITRFNHAFESLTGKSADEVIGKPIEILFPPDRVESSMDLIKKTQSGERWVIVEINILHTNGSVRNVLWNSATIFAPDGKTPEATIAQGNDITERRQAEEEQMRILKGLRRSNEELQQFAYIASHDLQEPLRMIASYLQLIEKRYKGKLDKDADEFIGFAVDGAIRLQEMIIGLLAYSRVGTKIKPLEEVNFSEVLGNAILNLKVVIEESGALITTDRLPVIKADAVQLVQVFQNLISNAIKFRRKDEMPRIHISANPNPETERGWLFSVKDNGIGIAPEYKGRIFKLFQRLHGREEYPGVGIGLSLCRRIIERHGGHIWFESEIGKGTVFYFTIPAREVEK